MSIKYNVSGTKSIGRSAEQRLSNDYVVYGYPYYDNGVCTLFTTDVDYMYFVKKDKNTIYVDIRNTNNIKFYIYDVPNDQFVPVGGQETGLTFDTVPTTNSNNPVTSSGIKAAVTEAFSTIPFGKVDSTSTSTVFTATVPGITELKSGTCVMLYNGVVTSASGYTININGLGAYPTFNNMTASTRDTTIFNVAYTMLFVFDEERVVDGITGAWCCYRGYDANTNTIGYEIRTNYSTLPAKINTRRYRLLFTSADHNYWVAANSATSTNATSARTVTTEKIDPFGPIVYYGTTAAVDAGNSFSTSYLWQQHNITLGHSFNRTGAALVLQYPKPVYIKCAPQTDGSAIIDADNPYVQVLPSTEDGKIYIYLGLAYSETNVELKLEHPVYYYKDGAIRLWSNANVPTNNTVTIFSGSSTPSNSLGNNGDIYIELS